MARKASELLLQKLHQEIENSCTELVEKTFSDLVSELILSMSHEFSWSDEDSDKYEQYARNWAGFRKTKIRNQDIVPIPTVSTELMDAEDNPFADWCTEILKTGNRCRSKVHFNGKCRRHAKKVQ